MLGAKDKNGVPTTAKQMTQTGIGVSTFTVESEPSARASTSVRRSARICQLVGVACKSGEEAAKSSELLRVLIELARVGGRAGAAARAAVDDRPRGAAGELGERARDRDRRDDRAQGRGRAVAEAARRSRGRTAAWQLDAAARSARGEPERGRGGAEQLAAIEAERSLLAEPDPLVARPQALAGASAMR